MMHSKLSLIFTTLVLLVYCTGLSTSYKILVSILTPAKSHYNQGKAIADILHERGHEVTFVNRYPTKKLPYREIIIPEIDQDDFDVGFEDSKQSYANKFQYLQEAKYFVEMMISNALKSETLHKFWNNKDEKFDLVIIDYLYNDVFLALGVKYNCPVLLLSPAPMLQQLADATGNPISPATIPNFFLDFTAEMTLVERIVNTAMAVVLRYHGYFFYDKINEDLYKKYFPAEANKLEYSDLKNRISVVLSNTYPALGFPRPYLPNIVEIGGFHIPKQLEPLSNEYKDILDNAKNGVIFFSMGSYLKTHKIPKRLRDTLLKSLSKLKETVLWKFETHLPDLPKNVIIKKWMPQTSILAHPNVKLFISHGGILSTTEATLSGVPLIAFPVIADQYYNAKMITNANTGLSITFDKLTEEKFDSLLNEVLTNRTYYENAKKLQKIYLDRPISPRDLVSFYAEHVIRTGGAKHLSAPRLNMFSSMLLDVIAVLAIPPILLIVAIFCICKRICCSKKIARSKTEKQKRN